MARERAVKQASDGKNPNFKIMRGLVRITSGTMEQEQTVRTTDNGSQYFYKILSGLFGLLIRIVIVTVVMVCLFYIAVFITDLASG